MFVPSTACHIWYLWNFSEFWEAISTYRELLLHLMTTAADAATGCHRRLFRQCDDNRLVTGCHRTGDNRGDNH